MQVKVLKKSLILLMALEWEPCIVSGGGDVCVNSNTLLIVTLLLLAGDVEVNPGPGGSSLPCGLCEIDANWSNGGIACEHCDVWYHRDCAHLNLSSFNRSH